MKKENLLEVVDKYHPRSLSALRSALLAENLEFEDAELLQLVRQLGSEGELVLVERGRQGSFRNYLLDVGRSGWLYTVLIATILEPAIVLSNSPNPIFLFLRAIFGIALLAFAPGYSATRAIFPAMRFPWLERVLLGIFLSLVVSIGIGTLLGSFLLFDATLNTILISAATLLLAVIGGFRGSREVGETDKGTARSPALTASRS